MAVFSIINVTFMNMNDQGMETALSMDVSELLEYGRQVVGEADERVTVCGGARIRVPPLRSVLYVPGNRRDWIQKCHRYGADGIAIDLEDAVHPEDRDAARSIVRQEIGPLSQRVRSVWVRVNPAEDALRADLEAAVQPGLSVVQLSKVNAPEQVVRLDRLLGYFEGRNGLAHGSIAIHPILESVGGVRNAYEIAVCSPRVEYLGALLSPEGDTARAFRMRAMSDPVGTESLYIRGKVVTDARTGGVVYPLGGVVSDLDPSHAVFRPFSEMNRNIGYSGMLVIHPSHVPVANAIFSPSAKDLERAVHILHQIRNSAGRAAIRGPDQAGMIDLAMARYAFTTLEEARALGMEVPSSDG